MTKTELKLEVASADLKGLRRRLTAMAGRSRREALAATYFDTPDHRLQSDGLSLRVRREGKRYVQTVKASGEAAAGFFSRREWECPVAGEALDPARFAGTPIEELGETTGTLGPVFSATIERRIWTLRTGGDVVEIALDEGRIGADGIDAPLVELELELKRGNAAALFQAAEELRDAAAFDLSPMSKAERGYALLQRKTGSVFKAEPLRLAKDATAADAFAAIVQSCLRQFSLNRPLVVEDRTAEALHQARVAIRRLRSALSLFKDLVDDGEFEPIRAEYRALAGSLGEGRDLDVLIERLEPSPLRSHLEARRDGAYDGVVAAIGRAHSEALAVRTLRWSLFGAWREKAGALPARKFAAEVLDRRLRGLDKGRRKLAEQTPERRHRTRIAAKKLRYAGEFFASLFPQKRPTKLRETMLSNLEKLQTRLGNLNDGETATALIARYAEDGADLSTAEAPPIDEARELKKAQAAIDAVAATTPFWRPKAR